MKPEACAIISALTTKLAMHKDSHTVSKLKPKIRIIHILAPKIIKADAASFRELVQRLTGKPGDHRKGSRKNMNRTIQLPPNGLSTHHSQPSEMAMGLKIQEAIPTLSSRARVKNEENEMIYAGGNYNGFLGEFADTDGSFFPWIGRRLALQ